MPRFGEHLAQTELSMLYIKTSQWLVRHGGLVLQDVSWQDKQDGLPVLSPDSAEIHIAFQAPVKALQSVAPSSIEGLNIGDDGVALKFHPAHYRETEDGIEYIEPIVGFLVSRRPDSAYAREWLVIHRHPTEDDRFETVRMHDRRVSATAPKNLSHAATGVIDSMRFGTDRMDVFDYQSLNQIVDNLSDIKRFAASGR